MYLSDNGITSATIHGDMDHRDRQYTIKAFKNDEI